MESALRDIADLKVIETFRSGSLRFPRHLARAARTCEALGFVYSERAVLKAVREVPAGYRLRVTVDREGVVEVASAPFLELADDVVWKIAVSDQRLDAEAEELRFKTTERALYDQVRASLPSGVDEVIFANQRGEVCEGTITNIFADFGDGLVTPPVASGLLPGVLREEMLEAGNCREAVILVEQFIEAREIFVGNSLRGLIPVSL